MRAIIVGNSAAGVAAVDSLRSASPDAEITLIAEEEGPAYSRVLTSYYLSGQIADKRLLLVDEDFYRSRTVNTRFGRRVTRLSATENALTLNDGTVLGFDRLLIATGSSPQRLTVPGGDLPGVFTLRTRADARAIRHRADQAQATGEGAGRAVVVGGGLVAFKAAEALHARGLAVTMVVSSQQVLSQILDPVTAGLVRRDLEGLGITLLLGENVAGIQGAGRVELVATDRGREIPCDLVVVGKGVRPNVEWLLGSGVDVHRGVVVDGFLRTSRPDVWAAGDVAETWDLARGEKRVNALWGNAVEQGRIAGTNMGSPSAAALAYPGSLSENSLHWEGLSVISVGEVNPPADDPRYRVLDRRDGVRFYRRLVFREGRLIGAALYGDVRGAGILRSLILSGGIHPPLSEAQAAELLAPGLNYGRVYRHLAPASRPVSRPS